MNNERASRLRSMAQKAIDEYSKEAIAGGEPTYPAWADDVLGLLEPAPVVPAPAASVDTPEFSNLLSAYKATGWHGAGERAALIAHINAWSDERCNEVINQLAASGAVVPSLTDERILTLAADHHLPVRFPHETVAFGRALLALATNLAPQQTDELSVDRHAALRAAPAGLLNADELAALHRFNECALDGQGYDVPKEMMARLAEIGVLRRKSGAYYEHTEFGLAVLDGSHQFDIGALVSRFLGWPLPASLHDALGRIEKPIGTHLMNADEARAMFEYVLAARCRAEGGNTIANSADFATPVAGWVSVEDERKPNEHELVAVIGPAYGSFEKGRYVSSATYYNGEFFTEDGDMMHPPSHWCALPPAPVATPTQQQEQS